MELSHSALGEAFQWPAVGLVVEMRAVSLFLFLSSLGLGMALPSGSLSQYNYSTPSRRVLLTERSTNSGFVWEAALKMGRKVIPLP